ncbi:hypothetical protein KCU86_g24028, partial [Aureobasidium melanogenum]
MFPGSILIPIGLFIYGWTAENKTFWIGPDIGAVCFAAGTILVFQSCQTYVIDSYQRYAASAVASTTVLRSLAGFGFPLFAPAMYNALGYGWGNSVLGFIAVGIGIPAPFLLWNNSGTYGHSQLKTGHPVRSAIHKQLNGRLVLRWVTTWESLL